MPYTINTAKAKIKTAQNGWRNIDVFSGDSVKNTQGAALAAIGEDNQSGARGAAIAAITNAQSAAVSQVNAAGNRINRINNEGATLDTENADMIAEDFDETKNYSAGKYVRKAITTGSGNNATTVVKLFNLTNNYIANSGWANASVVEVNTGDQISNLKNDINNIAGNGFYTVETLTNWTNGGYYGINVAEGTTVDLTTLVSSQNSIGQYVEVSKGDIFIVKGHGGSGPRLWGWLDTQKKLLSKAAEYEIAYDPGLELVAENDGYLVVNVSKNAQYYLKKKTYVTLTEKVTEIKNNQDTLEQELLELTQHTQLVTAQSYISQDWHFPFINVWQNMGLGSAHQIPNTANLWTTGTSDLDQKGIWMQDGIHPFKGAGVTPMYAKTIVEQLKMICPSYRNSQGETDTDPVDWTGKVLLWMGTSIPAGSDPSAGSGTGTTYPAMVATQLGATCINKAKGSSCLRINASTGEYTGMKYDHFIRSVTRTVAECDLIASDWSNIYPKLVGAPSTLSAADLQTMKEHSFENLLLPYMNGQQTSPDLWVIDYGHNDIRPLDIYGNRDTYVKPTAENIESGLLAEDEYMTSNNYANLKTAFNSTLSGITDLQSFSASVNRNCFIGSFNFLITLIMSYNPYARIVIISDYN